MSEGRHQVSSVLCLTICCLMTVCGRHVPNAMSGRGVPLMTFRLTRITQQPANNGHNVQLHFTGTDPDLPTVYLTNLYVRHGQPERLGKPSNGIIEFHTDSREDWVMFLHPRGYQRISITLNEHSPSEQFVPDMELSLQEGRDVTFQSGDDVDVNYVFSVGNDNRSEISSFSLYSGVAIKSNTEDHVVKRYAVRSQFPFRDLNNSKSERERRGHVRLMTSSGNVEGLVELVGYAGYKSENENLIEDYLVHEDVPLYQEGDVGPFPDNYLGLLKYGYHESSNRKLCSFYASRACLLLCDFVGDQPSAVVFVRVAGDLIPTHQMSLSNGGFRALGMLTFENLTAPGEVEYQCKSSSGSREVSHTMKLAVIHYAKINRNLTNVTTLDDGTAEAVCVAEGTPAPTVFLAGTNFTFSSTSGDVNSGPYEMVFTKPDNSTTVAVLRVRNRVVANSLGYVICTARNEVLERPYTDEAALYFPPAGQRST